MKKTFLLIGFLFLILVQSFSQKVVLLNQLPQIEFNSLDNDTARIFVSPKLYDFSIITFSRKQEYFEPTDTLQRDYIIFNNVKYVIDSLVLKHCSSYTQLFNLTHIYKIERKSVNYVILSGGNLFQMGTDSQPLFILFKENNKNKYVFYSSYYIENIEDNSTRTYDAIKVIFNKNGIYLKGKSLKCVHRNRKV